LPGIVEEILSLDLYRSRQIETQKKIIEQKKKKRISIRIESKLGHHSLFFFVEPLFFLVRQDIVI